MIIEFKTILEIVTKFYDKANNDILIGYHFRVIEDFDNHLPRIAYFWQLQLTGSIDDRSMLPFDLIPLHKALKVNKGEIFRWVVLFEKTLEESVLLGKISADDKVTWMSKISTFKEKLVKILI